MNNFNKVEYKSGHVKCKRRTESFCQMVWKLCVGTHNI